jgi:hypothetical protein
MNDKKNAEHRKAEVLSAKKQLDVVLLIALVITSFVGAYWMLSTFHNVRGIAMFIGIPLVIGFVTSLARPREEVGSTLKFITLCLCVIAPLLGEGLICILYASPIIYVVAAVIAVLCKYAKKRQKKMLSVAIMLPFVYSVMTSVPLENLPMKSLVLTKTFSASPQEIWDYFQTSTVRLDQSIPMWLRFGFPQFQKLVIQDLHRGNQQELIFDNGRIVGKVSQSVPYKKVVLDLKVADPQHEFFHKWIIFHKVAFILTPVSADKTELTVLMDYQRLLSPEIYFSPLEIASAHLLTDHLFDVIAQDLEGRS